ncbi:MAG: bifunctional DNA-formamidopyrimidine glycosylase/DNA-(apurinic or apyrimidinic site) lyase [Acidimicrobiales bacterium]
MPELPEVETIRRQLSPLLPGRVVVDAWSHPSAKFTPAVGIVGARFDGVARRGKFLLLALSDGRELVVHLGMTGSLLLVTDPDAAAALATDPYVRARWALEGRGEGAGEGPVAAAEAELVFRDIRRFGRLRVVPGGDHRTIPTLAAMGPEPFDPDLDGDRFAALLARSRRRLKTQLLSQRPIAGVGNIYADEALWLAGINPRVTRLGPQRAAALLAALRQVLAQGIDNGGTTLRDYRNAEGGWGSNQATLAAYGRAGLPCLRCGTPLRSAVIDARSTTWCGACQRR